MHGNQRRGAGSIYRHTWSTQIEQVGQAIGSDTVRIARTGVRIEKPRIAILKLCIIIATDADKDSCLAPGELIGCLSRMLQGFPCNFKQKALLWVHASCLTRRNAEEGGIELVDVLQEASPARVHFAWSGSL